MHLILKRKRNYTPRQEKRKFTYLPLIHKGNLFWLSSVKIEKAFNGMAMKIINIQKI